MRIPEENHAEFDRFSTRFWWSLEWLNSGHILPALEESDEDSKRHNLRQNFLWESISGEELLAYHRQLFTWRVMRFKLTARHSLSN